MSEPWNTDMWFTSPWNFEGEVTSNIKFDPNPKIHDVTLRDGEQQAGVMFNKDEKIRIAEALAETGVHRIEAGMPVVSPSDEAAIREIVKRLEGTDTEVFSFARCMADDVKRSADTGVKGVVMEVPSSTHMIERAYKWGARQGHRHLRQGHAGGEGMRPLHRVLPHRLLPRPAGLGAGPAQEGGDRGPHGRAGDRGHVRRAQSRTPCPTSSRRCARCSRTSPSSPTSTTTTGWASPTR